MKSRAFAIISERDYDPEKFADLARQLDIPKTERKALRAVLEELQAEGKIRKDTKNRYHLGLRKNEVVGVVRRTSRGTGFLRPTMPPPKSPDEEIFIAPEDMKDAFDRDEVLVKLTSRRRRNGQRCGKIRSVISRRSSQFVGTYEELENLAVVRVDGNRFPHPIPVGDPGAKGVTVGDKVVIEMLRYPTQFEVGEAVLTKVLGEKGTPGLDTQMIVAEFELPGEFPEPVLEEARVQAEAFEEKVPDDREDLTGDITVTIDPVDARDFDDAISLKRTKGGHWHLSVHIADVAHFVKPGGALDREAETRGTSVYLPGQVIPMLPEIISNGLASLQQGKVRLTKTCHIEFDAEGTRLNTRFSNSAIKVNRRFAYEQVMPIVNDPERFKGQVPAKVRKLLSQMHELAMMLRRKRFDSGAVSMGMPEVKIDFDKQGRVSGAHESVHDESHEIIEEFMLAANIAVATELFDRDILFLRRVHPDPRPEKLAQFRDFAAFLGHPIKNVGRDELNRVMKEVRGTPMESSLSYALLRSFKQAEYSPEELGHYALAEPHYCHFTSPIRRYPDLTVHRIIDRIVTKKRTKSLSPEVLISLGGRCTDSEKRAERAERELVKLKLLEYMSGQIGEMLHGRITGVEKFGVFCRGEEIPAEGLIPMEALEAFDRFDYDEESRAMIGRRSAAVIRLGQPLTVRVASVDMDARKLTFGIDEDVLKKLPKASAATRKRQSRGDRSDRQFSGRGGRSGGDKQKGPKASEGRRGSSRKSARKPGRRRR